MKKILILAFLLLPTIIQAAGIQVSLSKMDFAVEIGGGVAIKELVVVNPTADVQVFEVYPDEFSEIIKANPTSFTLEAGARKTVMVKVDPTDIKGSSKILRTNFSVLGRPLVESRLQTNTGVKIPILIIIDQETIKTESDNEISAELFYLILIIVAFGSGLVTYLIKHRKKFSRDE
ncbi:hypothetical protein KAJ41_01775 [Candidatus Parcubacteria bacterium]|nr:hypothetical protein [Candidatus Parcubacteria bacterium]